MKSNGESRNEFFSSHRRIKSFAEAERVKSYFWAKTVYSIALVVSNENQWQDPPAIVAIRIFFMKQSIILQWRENRVWNLRKEFNIKQQKCAQMGSRAKYTHLCVWKMKSTHEFCNWSYAKVFQMPFHSRAVAWPHIGTIQLYYEQALKISHQHNDCFRIEERQP